ncbi:putative C-S lyase [Carnobacterium maltaromaticum]|uniref:VOC family protein n=1 Tax=Carnobacterium maltaromaticum TaxID=2751 RepID=UPI00191BA0CE|nr:VOC family protein [Carnobacterium maltaromaticum]CAD5899521.1 putative C-S lyase [Carnobacterium maltaromaticum]
MKIEHVAIWVKDLETTRKFYQKYFNASVNDLYHNATKGFTSYFLTFESGARLEIMQRTDIVTGHEGDSLGWAHIAFSVGSKEQVVALTERLVADGYACLNGPRLTGDGYFESVVEDPEKNLIEITE